MLQRGALQHRLLDAVGRCRPIRHERTLFLHLRRLDPRARQTSPQLGDSRDRFIARDALLGEPAPDDRAGAPDAAPTVKIHRTTRVDLGSDHVENLAGERSRRNIAILDWKTKALALDAGFSRQHVDNRRVRNERLTVFRQIDERTNAGLDKARETLFRTAIIR